jgi:hypothetical protein
MNMMCCENEDDYVHTVDIEDLLKKVIKLKKSGNGDDDTVWKRLSLKTLDGHDAFSQNLPKKSK